MVKDRFIKFAEKIVGARYTDRRLGSIQESRSAYRKPFLDEMNEFLYGSSGKDHILDNRRAFHARKLYKEYFTFNCKSIWQKTYPGSQGGSYKFYELTYRDNCGRRAMVLTGKGVQEYAMRIYEKDYQYKSDHFIKNIEDITGKEFLLPHHFNVMLSRAQSKWVAYLDRSCQLSPRDCCKRGLKVGEAIYVKSRT